MPYVEQTWTDTPGDPNAQVNAARMNHIEQGISDATEAAENATQTYDTLFAGLRVTILYNGVAWPGARPSSRTDIFFDCIGGGPAVADPAWMITGDAREVVV